MSQPATKLHDSAPATNSAASASGSIWERLPALLTLIGGFFLSGLLFLLVQQSETNRLRTNFIRWSQNRAATLQHGIKAHLDMLQFMGSFYISSRHVDRREFGVFAKDNLNRLRGIRLLEWIPAVTNSERSQHEASIRAEGLSDYHIWEHDSQGGLRPAVNRPAYFPVLYVLPRYNETNRLGFDLASVEEYAAAMRQAVEETTEPVMTRQRRTNSQNQSPAWRAFLAAYTNGIAHQALEARRKNLAGFISAELKMDYLAGQLVDAQLPVQEEEIAIRLTDLTRPREIAFQSPHWPKQAPAATAIAQTNFLHFGSRQWELICVPTPKFLAHRRVWQAWTLLASSLILSILASAYLFNTSNREKKISRLVEERTSALSQANQDLKAEVEQRMATERKLEQERYLMEALMESTPDHIYFKDRKSRFLRVSRAQAERFKLTNPVEAIGKSDFDFFTNEHAQSAYDDEQEIVRTGQPMVGREEKETWPDGSYSWVFTTKQCLRDKAGNIIGTFGISRDITAHKAAEEALAKKTEELLRSNQELEQFAYVASHDLQEPLRMISSYTQLLARRYRGKLDSDADEFIGYAVDGAARMQTLINDLLTYSRVGRKGKPFAPVQSGEALKRALDNLKVAIDDSRAEVQCENLPEIMADDVQLTQLFQNLVSNAIKFRGKAPLKVRISASLQPRGQESEDSVPPMEWVFKVQDNGMGIEQEYFDRIFIIFQRLHTRDQYPGTGIGLSVCKKIVERHGGRMWVESKPGQGASFYFTIPQTPMST